MNYPSSLRGYCIRGLYLGALCFLGSQLFMAHSPVLQNTVLPEPSQITSAGRSIPFTQGLYRLSERHRRDKGTEIVSGRNQ